MPAKKPYPVRTVTFYANDDLMQQLKQVVPSKHGAIAEAINEGMRLYLEKQAQNVSK